MSAKKCTYTIKYINKDGEIKKVEVKLDQDYNTDENPYDAIEQIANKLFNDFQNGDRDVNEMINSSLTKVEEETPSNKTSLVYNKSLSQVNEIMSSVKELFPNLSIEILDYESDDEFNHVEKGKKAFISNGNIYLSAKNMTPDTVFHELLHLMLGEYRRVNYDAYSELLNDFNDTFNESDNSDFFSKSVDENMSPMDYLEELFVDVVASHVNGVIQSDGIINEELLSSALNSVFESKNKTNENMELLQTKVLDLLNFGSDNLNTKFPKSKISRRISNVKSDAIKSGHLKIECI